MADLLFTTDLEDATKEQLRSLVKRVREESGRPIDLRKADIVALRQYLTDYLTAQAAASDPEPQAEAVAHTLSDFEGIDQVAMERTDWTAATPLSCDVCNYQVCDLPAAAEPEAPQSFNTISQWSIDTILCHSNVHGDGRRPAGSDRIDKDWLCGILRDCVSRSIRPERVKESLILKDHIFLGLAGLPISEADTLKAVIRRPSEFGDLSPESEAYHQNMSALLGCDGMTDMIVHHMIRDNLNYLQQLLGISCLEPRSYAVRDCLFTTQDYNSQLQILESDRLALKSEAPRVAAYFELVAEGYTVEQEMDDDTTQPFDIADLAGMASIAEYAWVYAESFDWEPTSDGGYVGRPVQRQRSLQQQELSNLLGDLI